MFWSGFDFFLKYISKLIITFRREAEKVSREMTDAPMSPMDTAAFWIEYVARHGKKCLRSPLVDMPWWQASLLDVYAFIGIVSVVILYVIKVILSFLLCTTGLIGASSSKVKRN